MSNRARGVSSQISEEQEYGSVHKTFAFVDGDVSFHAARVNQTLVRSLAFSRTAGHSYSWRYAVLLENDALCFYVTKAFVLSRWKEPCVGKYAYLLSKKVKYAQLPPTEGGRDAFYSDDDF